MDEPFRNFRHRKFFLDGSATGWNCSFIDFSIRLIHNFWNVFMFPAKMDAIHQLPERFWSQSIKGGGCQSVGEGDRRAERRTRDDWLSKIDSNTMNGLLSRHASVSHRRLLFPLLFFLPPTLRHRSYPASFSTPVPPGFDSDGFLFRPLDPHFLALPFPSWKSPAAHQTYVQFLTY